MKGGVPVPDERVVTFYAWPTGALRAMSKREKLAWYEASIAKRGTCPVCTGKLTRTEALTLLGVSQATLSRWRKQA